MVSLTLIFHKISETDLLRLSPTSHIKTLYSEVPKLQHHTKLCSRCNILLVSTLNLSPIGLWKVFLLLNATFAVETLALFSHTSFSICYWATQGFEIFHVLLLFWSIIIFTVDDCLEILITLVFFLYSFPYHNVLQLQLVCQSCSVIQFLP